MRTFNIEILQKKKNTSIFFLDIMFFILDIRASCLYKKLATHS